MNCQHSADANEVKCNRHVTQNGDVCWNIAHRGLAVRYFGASPWVTWYMREQFTHYSISVQYSCFNRQPMYSCCSRGRYGARGGALRTSRAAWFWTRCSLCRVESWDITVSIRGAFKKFWACLSISVEWKWTKYNTTFLRTFSRTCNCDSLLNYFCTWCMCCSVSANNLT